MKCKSEHEINVCIQYENNLPTNYYEDKCDVVYSHFTIVYV